MTNLTVNIENVKEGSFEAGKRYDDRGLIYSRCIHGMSAQEAEKKIDVKMVL